MPELLLIIGTLLAAAVTLLCRKHDTAARRALLTGALLHFAGTAALLLFRRTHPTGPLGSWLQLDRPGAVVLAVLSLLFLFAAVNAQSWLPNAKRFEHAPHGMRESLFCGLLLTFLATMTLVTLARNFGLLWVAVEATTLASAPLILFHRSNGALEAMWKYLLICSVGIGLALLGTFMLTVAIRTPDGSFTGLAFDVLTHAGNTVHPAWFKAAFIFCFAGYGLKMGLSPFHTWLPDAHSEAPSVVSVLMSGALLNCSFLGILRVLGTASPDLLPFCRELLVAFGLLSLATAAFFLIRQQDFKRMLAYSSIEHMGLIALLCGLQAGPEFLFTHLFFHSCLKAVLFLTAGHILLAFNTRRIDAVQGLFRVLPVNAAVWLLAVLLICGLPPSPLFFTEFRLIQTAGPVLGSLILLLLFTVFAAMTHAALRMTFGSPVRNSLQTPALAAADSMGRFTAALLLVITAAAVMLLTLNHGTGGC